ncbi:hypothetical protein EK904_001543 [Melospiza melodia maxima]|nr:hypothetical protein EK904_001543 [Melospiza melodia maxima]
MDRLTAVPGLAAATQACVEHPRQCWCSWGAQGNNAGTSSVLLFPTFGYFQGFRQQQASAGSPSQHSQLSGTSLSFAPKCSLFLSYLDSCSKKRKSCTYTIRAPLSYLGPDISHLLEILSNSDMPPDLRGMKPQQLSSDPSTGPFSCSSLQHVSVRAFSIPEQDKTMKDMPALCPPGAEGKQQIKQTSNLVHINSSLRTNYPSEGNEASEKITINPTKASLFQNKHTNFRVTQGIFRRKYSYINLGRGQ